jgi:hypothetical protein
MEAIIVLDIYRTAGRSVSEKKKLTIKEHENEEPRKMPNPNSTTASHHIYSDFYRTTAEQISHAAKYLLTVNGRKVSYNQMEQSRLDCLWCHCGLQELVRTEMDLVAESHLFVP